MPRFIILIYSVTPDPTAYLWNKTIDCSVHYLKVYVGHKQNPSNSDKLMSEALCPKHVSGDTKNIRGKKIHRKTITNDGHMAEFNTKWNWKAIRMNIYEFGVVQVVLNDWHSDVCHLWIIYLNNSLTVIGVVTLTLCRLSF